MTLNPVRTWAETAKRADALEEIADILAKYLPPNSGVSPKEALSEIIGAVERNTGIRFVRLVEAG